MHTSYGQNYLLIEAIQKYEINYEMVGSEFYGYKNNILPRKKLHSLAQIAKNIEEPSLYGQYNNPSHYFQTLELVLESTNETRNRKIFFRKKILPLIAIKNNLLDVGPGNGKLLKAIANGFKHITIIDTNEKAINKLNKIKKADFDFIKIHGSILDIKLTNYFFDLAVLSHVLYYINQNKWLNVVRQVYNAINRNGMVVIVLSGDNLGKSNLIEHFGGRIPDVDKLAQQCMETFGYSNVKVYASDESFITLNLATMLHIAGFMLYDVGISVNKKQLENYIKQHFRYSDDYFKMSTRQKFILIFKSEEVFYNESMHNII